MKKNNIVIFNQTANDKTQLFEQIKKCIDKEQWLIVTNSINITENTLKGVFIELLYIENSENFRII